MKRGGSCSPASSRFYPQLSFTGFTISNNNEFNEFIIELFPPSSCFILAQWFATFGVTCSRSHFNNCCLTSVTQNICGTHAQKSHHFKFSSPLAGTEKWEKLFQLKPTDYVGLKQFISLQLRARIARLQLRSVFIYTYSNPWIRT